MAADDDSGFERIELPALRQLNMQLAARAHTPGCTAALRLVGPRLEALTGRLSDALLARLQQRCPPWCALCWLGLADELYDVDDGGGDANGPVSGAVGNGRLTGWQLAGLPPRLAGVGLLGRLFARQRQLNAVFCVWAQHAPLQRLVLLVRPHWLAASTLAAVAAAHRQAAPAPLFARLTELQLPVRARAVSELVNRLTSAPRM